ncbi:hypothetical protein [Streptomyces sp. NPDC002490]|uniref:hypothetical protein n=1 Tax=Streptomyces sp. NPDC002490 TaxID=3154416 RepID=UPI003323A635
MSGPNATVNDPRGPVHTGSGNQYIWMVGENERLVRAGRTRLTIVREHRRRLARSFVRPGGYTRAAGRLAEPGAVVLLSGSPGTGRRTAATMLLEEVRGVTAPVEDLPPTGDEEAPGVLAEGRYLLDLSDVEDTDITSAQDVLMRYRSEVERLHARMAVVLPSGSEWMLRPDLAPLVVPLERPSGRAVFCRCLKANGIEIEPDLLDDVKLRHMFEAAPLHELGRLAARVVDIRDSGRYGTSFAQWLEEAVKAATDRAGEVAAQLRERRGAGQRALLLSTAMFSGGSAEVVQSAGRLLLETLRIEDDDRGLDRADLSERFEKLSVERDLDGRVRFARLAYDGAVRRHFWQNFPDLRDAFRSWTAGCVQLRELTAEDRMNLVGRFAEETLAAGRPDDLCTLVETWTRGPGRRFRAEAAAALEQGLSHERYGARFRERVRVWAAGSIPPDLARVLTDVCQQVIAATHPEQAAVRLRHLALRQQGPEGAAARSALLDLARNDAQVFVRLTDRLVKQPLSYPAVEILLGLLDPEGLRIGLPPQQFVLAWRAVLLTRTSGEWAPLLSDWLTALVVGDHPEDLVTRGVLLATGGDRSLLHALYTTACAWEENPSAPRPRADPPAAARARVAERFCQEIDRVLGVTEAPSTTPGPPWTREYA